MENCNNCGCISGIKCEVKNCHYHTTENGCKAENIQVGNCTANESSQTQCNTFKPCN